MKLGIEYWPETDMLTINLSDKPAGGGGEEISDGIVLHYDDADKLNYIEISGASELVDLKQIRARPGLVIDEQADPVIIYTPSAIANKLGVSIESIHKTLQVMRKAGVSLGRKANETYSNSPQILSEADYQMIKKWRAEHRPGRPRKEEMVR